MYPLITLKSGREGSVVHRHPWVFSGAIAAKPANLANGDFVRVAAAEGRVLGVGNYSTNSQIAVRLLSFRDEVIDAGGIETAVRAAIARRAALGLGLDAATTGYRVIFGESDALPGIVVDRYGDVLVLQSSTAGSDRLKGMLVSSLVESFHSRAIIERSDIAVRREEGLEPVEGVLQGVEVERVEFRQNNWRFVADVAFGQKTGFFLDQAELRLMIHRLARGRRVLNLFANSGSFAIAALTGGACAVHNVDSSAAALESGRELLELNGIDASLCSDDDADVFQWLSAAGRTQWDMVILDPPALIKSQSDAEPGRKAYHFLNRAAIRLVAPDGILVTSSCSSFFKEEDFLFMLRRASVQADRSLDLLAAVGQSADHPWSIYFPESRYLKSFVCRVR